MATTNGAEPPPRSTDVDTWRTAVIDGRFTRFRLEDIVAAIQDLGPCADKDVLNPLAKHLSDALLRILRQHVSIHHPNRGDDIIERTHGHIVDAILRPNSADGKGFRQAFVPRVKFRLKDALAAEARAARDSSGTINGERASEDDFRSDTASTAGRSRGPRHDPTSENDERIDVERVLARIPNDQKRLAFRLYMDNVPFKSKKSQSIAAALGISEKTARDWIKEVQDLLSSAPEVQELLQPKQMRGKP